MFLCRRILLFVWFEVGGWLWMALADLIWEYICYFDCICDLVYISNSMTTNSSFLWFELEAGLWLGDGGPPSTGNNCFIGAGGHLTDVL